MKKSEAMLEEIETIKTVHIPEAEEALKTCTAECNIEHNGLSKHARLRSKLEMVTTRLDVLQKNLPHVILAEKKEEVEDAHAAAKVTGAELKAAEDEARAALLPWMGKGYFLNQAVEQSILVQKKLWLHRGAYGKHSLLLTQTLSWAKENGLQYK